MSISFFKTITLIASGLLFLAASPAQAKTPTQIKNEQRAIDYKAKKSAEKTARKAEQASRKRK